MTNEKHVDLTNAERKVFLRLYSGLVELQASALYYVSEGLNNAGMVERAATATAALQSLRREVFGDPCGAGLVPCGNGDCRPPGGCGPSLHKSTPKGGKRD